MSTAFDQGDSDNPFDASYEEYVRVFGEGEGTPASDPFGASGDTEDAEAETPDDPEVTQASAQSADFVAQGGVEAPWSNVAATTENDPFATTEGDTAPEGEAGDSSPRPEGTNEG